MLNRHCIQKRIPNVCKELQKLDLTCLSVVVTGFALFLGFKCLFATWKTFVCFFPFCLFFAMLPEDRTPISGERFNFCNIACVLPCFYPQLLCSLVLKWYFHASSLLSKREILTDCSSFSTCRLHSAATWLATPLFTKSPLLQTVSQKTREGQEGQMMNKSVLLKWLWIWHILVCVQTQQQRHFIDYLLAISWTTVFYQKVLHKQTMTQVK